MRIIKSIFTFLILIAVCNNLFSDTRELEWKTHKQVLDNESKIDENMRQIIRNRLVDVFNNDLTDDCIKNSVLNEDEKNYYFTDNTYSKNNNTDDFICLRHVKIGGDIFIRHSTDSIGELYFRVKFGIEVKISNSNNNKTYKYSGKKEWNQSWGSGVYKYEKEKSFTAGDIYSGNAGNPIIRINPFDRSPGEYYTYKYTVDDDKVDDLHDLKWRDKYRDTYLFHAKSPQPYFSEINKDIFSPDGTTYAKEVFDTTITTVQGVKILLIQIYELDNNDQPILSTKQEIFNNIEVIEISGEAVSEERINNITISGNSFTQQGRYIIYTGAIDNFNKIYIFEPEYITIDNTPPVIDGLVTNDDLSISTTIVSWNSVTDNMTVYNNIQDYNKYIKIRYKNGILKSLADCIEFEYENNGIKFNDNLTGKKTYIDRIYITDKAGNETNLIIDKNFNLDKIEPEILIKGKKDFYNSNDTVELIFKDDSKLKVNKIEIKTQTNTYDYNNLQKQYESLYEYNHLNIPLIKLKGIEENNIELFIEVEDEAGNINSSLNVLYFNIDDKLPQIDIFFNNTIANDSFIILNQKQALKINITELNFSHFDIKISSDFNNSTNILEQTNITEKSIEILELITDSNTNCENLKIEIDAFDISGNITTKLAYAQIFNDTDEPGIISSLNSITSQNEYNYDIEIKDNTSISAWIKSIDTISLGRLPDYRDFDDFNPDITNNWVNLVENYDKNEQIEEIFTEDNLIINPGFAVCIVAVDKWGNKNHIILTNNESNNAIIINNKQDLFDNFGTNIDGEITYNVTGTIYFKPGTPTDALLTIDSNETLNIFTELTHPTLIYFDDLNGMIKIINNMGTINFNPDNNQIILKSIESIDDTYNWFGIQNQNGNINFINANYNIIIQDAVSALTFIEPGNDITINNVSFSNCIMGIHFIDICEFYNVLEIINSEFSNLIYGIKYEIDSYENSELYNFSSSMNYLINNGSIFNTNISIGDVYCPINGNIDIQ